MNAEVCEKQQFKWGAAISKLNWMNRWKLTLEILFINLVTSIKLPENCIVASYTLKLSVAEILKVRRSGQEGIKTLQASTVCLDWEL